MASPAPPWRWRNTSAATNTMLSAMTASTGAIGSRSRSSVARLRVIECATVNAVTVQTSRRAPLTSSNRARTKNR
ncbi:hypothetical protein D3C71_1672840 [compost metagenome]